MELAEYHAYTQALLNNVQNDGRILGLVALGSMAEQGRTPDNWSDHDFFLIVQSGIQEEFRQALAWLPESDRIIMSIRETAHGLKVLYDFPHLIEFAVFDLEELNVAKANDYRILLDRGDIDAAMQRIRQPETSDKPYDPNRDLLMVLALIYVGAGRSARGEDLSAHMFIKQYVLFHLLPLLIYGLGGHKSGLDNLDPFRRVERIYPELGAQLNAALLLPPVECGEALLDITLEYTQQHISPFPGNVVNTVQQYLHNIQIQKQH